MARSDRFEPFAQLGRILQAPGSQILFVNQQSSLVAKFQLPPEGDPAQEPDHVIAHGFGQKQLADLDIGVVGDIQPYWKIIHRMGGLEEEPFAVQFKETVLTDTEFAESGPYVKLMCLVRRRFRGGFNFSNDAVEIRIARIPAHRFRNIQFFRELADA